MERLARALCVGGGLIILVLAAGYAFQWPWAIATWPWPDGRLSYLFVASIQAAIAAAMLWIGLSGEWGSLPAGALNLLVMNGGLAVFMLGRAGQPGQGHLLYYGLGCGLLAVGCLALFVGSMRLPLPANRPTPRLVRLSFAMFTVILVLVGVALIRQTPQVMPWPLRPETSIVIGWIFFGDAFYFLYALLRPSVAAARAQLWSFLAYDLVLLGPFLLLLGRVAPEQATSLVIYLAVLFYSCGLAVYYLFVHPATRVVSAAESIQPVGATDPR